MQSLLWKAVSHPQESGLYPCNSHQARESLEEMHILERLGRKQMNFQGPKQGDGGGDIPGSACSSQQDPATDETHGVKEVVNSLDSADGRASLACVPSPAQGGRHVTDFPPRFPLIYPVSPNGEVASCSQHPRETRPALGCGDCGGRNHSLSHSLERRKTSSAR